MAEMHLKQPWFTYSACGSFTKNKQRIHKFMQTGNKIIFIRMILIKLVFNMIWLMANINIWLKKQNKTKFYEVKLLKLQVI